MTESKFVNSNREHWETCRNMVTHWKSYSPSELGSAYLRICSDLAYAQTNFPDTTVCSYLNSLALEYHHVLYRRQPQRWRVFLQFFTHDIPLSFYHSRWFLLLSLGVLLFGEVAGVLSQILDYDYFQRFFGYHYYNETMTNIINGKPMDIYASSDFLNMYCTIAINNILVGLRYFTDGLLTPFYVIYNMAMTGIMDGCFTTFFFQNGYGIDALIAPNEHGSIEVPAIIVCGAAGMQLGMGWFFPGKKTRLKALMETARRAMMMVLAAIPLFAFAAIIESCVTRYQDTPLLLRLAIVLAGLSFSLFYIVLLPMYLARKEEQQ